MSGITKSIEELVAENPDVDTKPAFEALWQITEEMVARVKEHFELEMDPCCDKLQPYEGKDGAEGIIRAYAGPEIDWMIHSWTGNPGASFSNMHVTISLSQKYDVPNFGFAMGTVPILFWYMDYIPRKELLTNPDYADKYYGGEVNDTYIEMDRNPDFTGFVSRDLYTRIAQTPCSICYGSEINDDNIATMRRMAHEQLDRWLAWVREARPVEDAAERQTMADRDLFIRRTICERDPANVVVDNLFGEELGKYLVDTLWGGNRTLPRPDIS